MRFLTIGLALLLAGAVQLNAANYYVDYSKGSDSNSGLSPTAAWKRCPGDSAAVGIAASVNLVAGDTVYFKGGVTYVFTGASGIALKWDGVSGRPITYDGNSSGTWGAGRARFVDNYSTRSITAFSSSTLRRYLTFKSLEIGPIGGASKLPLNLGLALAPKFGGGIAFRGGAETISIDECVFTGLGYWFSSRPMSAASLNGVGVAVSDVCRAVKITNSDFSNVAKACDFSGATELAGTEILSSTFRNGIVWSIDLPAGAGTPATTALRTDGTSFRDDPAFSGSWKGYGDAPRTETATVAVGSPIKLAAAAVASPTATFQWYKNGTAIAGATNVTLEISAAQTSHAGKYTAVAKNSLGWATSNSLVLTVSTTVARSAPKITQQPVNQSVTAGATVKFTAAATGSPTPTYQWQKNGVNISGATNSTLTLTNVATTASANYRVVVKNSVSSVTSNQAVLTVTAPKTSTSAPSISQQPASQTVTSGATATFSVTATGSPAPTYQWQKNGTNISGATTSKLTLSNVSSTSAGTYRVVVKNSVGTVTSSSATLTVTAPNTSESEDSVTPPLSFVLKSITAASPTTRVDFVVTGATAKNVLVRAAGPAFAAVGGAGVLSDPVLKLSQSGRVLYSNDNWGGSDALALAFTRVGAFPFPSDTSKDAALQVTLAPGTYTVEVSGNQGATGSVLVEVYDTATSSAL